MRGEQQVQRVFVVAAGETQPAAATYKAGLGEKRRVVIRLIKCEFLRNQVSHSRIKQPL